MNKQNRNAYEKELRRRNPEFAERQRANNRAWVAKNKDRKRAADKAYAEKNPARVRATHRAALLSGYGLTQDDYDRMESEQDGRCASCRRTRGRKHLFVDHNHTTGEVRGLLCFKCNAAVGLIGDDPLVAARLSLYLADNLRPTRAYLEI